MNFDGQVVCGVPDNVGSETCQWPFNDVSVYAEGNLGSVDLKEATRQAIAGWNKVCGIRLRLTDDAQSAHIRVTKGTIDGPGRTLAWSELPCGFSNSHWRQLTQKYDDERWTISDNPPSNMIDAVRVIAHEIGHAIGLPHIATGNLLAPTYSAAIRWPQRGDVLEAVSRYGKPSEPPSPPVVPPVTPDAPASNGFATIIAAVAKVVIGFLTSMSPEDRQALFRMIASLFRMLTPEQQAEFQKMMSE